MKRQRLVRESARDAWCKRAPEKGQVERSQERVASRGRVQGCCQRSCAIVTTTNVESGETASPLTVVPRTPILGSGTDGTVIAFAQRDDLRANSGPRSSPGRRSRRRSLRSVPGLGTDPGPSSSSAALRSTSSHVHAAADACASSRSSPRRRRCAASSAASASRPTLLLGPQRADRRTGGVVCCDVQRAKCRSRSSAMQATKR